MISSFFDDVNSLDCYTEYLSIFRWWSHHFNPLSYCDVTPPPPPLRRTPRLLLLTSGIKWQLALRLLCAYNIQISCRHWFPVPWTPSSEVPFKSSKGKHDHAQSGKSAVEALKPKSCLHPMNCGALQSLVFNATKRMNHDQAWVHQEGVF